MLDPKAKRFLLRGRPVWRWGTYWEYECGVERVASGRTHYIQLEFQGVIDTTGIRITCKRKTLWC